MRKHRPNRKSRAQTDALSSPQREPQHIQTGGGGVGRRKYSCLWKKVTIMWSGFFFLFFLFFKNNVVTVIQIEVKYCWISADNRCLSLKHRLCESVSDGSRSSEIVSTLSGLPALYHRQKCLFSFLRYFFFLINIWKRINTNLKQRVNYQQFT